MATQAELEASLVSLNEAYSSGALIVKHGDTQVTYRSIAELQQAIDNIQAQLNQVLGARRGPRYAIQRTKGL